MGLIGGWLTSLYFGYSFVVMSPLAFLARPVRWLQAVQHHHGTLSASPNFGYELCVRHITDDELVGLDLSTWRLTCNGAEPVSANTIRRFNERFGPYGFRPEAMAPVYGLAETAVGLTFPPLGRRPLIDAVDRETLARSGRAVPVSDEATARPRGVVRSAATRLRGADRRGRSGGPRARARRRGVPRALGHERLFRRPCCDRGHAPRGLARYRRHRLPGRRRAAPHR